MEILWESVGFGCGLGKATSKVVRVYLFSCLDSMFNVILLQFLFVNICSPSNEQTRFDVFSCEERGVWLSVDLNLGMLIL